ncbi:MAG: NAD(+)/NADH kinase [Candidatus Lokiarchaeota archaeon]
MENKSVAIASRMDSERAINLSKSIFNFLIERKIPVFLETRLAPKIMPHSATDLSQMTNENTKFVISVGGDGSLLRVVNSLSQKDPPPILGVNIGSVGFMDESNARNIFKDLEKVLNNEYLIEKCSKITPYIIRKNSEKIKLDSALNEILIVSSKSSKVLQVSVTINGVFLNRNYLDGVIISTSIGSTAYNLSAGGAIVFPKLDIMQIATLNAFAGSGLKPIVLPIDSEIEIKLLRPRLNAKIVIDGQKIVRNIQPNTTIVIKKAESCAKFIRLSKNLHKNYFRRLKKKIIGTLRIPIDDSPEE